VELCVLAVVPLGLLTNVLRLKAVTTIILGIGTIVFMIMDLLFSIVVTVAFLRPLLGVLSVKTDGECTATDMRLRTTVRTTLVGTSLTVFSSTLLYANVIAMSVWPDYVLGSAWAHPFVFGINVDSVTNDLGMLIASRAVISMMSKGTVVFRFVKRMSFGKIQPFQSENIPGISKKNSEDGSGGVLARKSEINPSSYEGD